MDQPINLPGIALWRTSELKRQGADSRKVARLVQEGRLKRVRRGCYVPAPEWKNLTSAQQEILRIIVHHHTSLPYSSGTLVYSHTSAARLHGLRVWQADQKIHVTQPFKASRAGNAADVVPHTAILAPGVTTEKFGLPVTDLEQTVVDCSRWLPYEQALIIAEHAFWLGADRNRMLAMVDALRGHKGVDIARKVLASASSLSESAGETRTLDFMRRMRIPLPLQQVEVTSRSGRHRLDFAWKEHKLALEFDGKTKYFDYAPTAEVLFQERRREKALMEEGWRILRIEWADLSNEPGLRRRILGALQARPYQKRGSVA